MRLVEVDGLELEVHDVGTGDPVVLVQTALIADEFAPLADHLVARGAYRAIVYHRRGYARSSQVQGPGQWLAMPPTAEISSLRWGSARSTSSAVPTAARLACCSPLSPRSTSTP
jgi:hypothetical protein